MTAPLVTHVDTGEVEELCTMAGIRAGKDLDKGWAVKYTEIRRADAIDMDPHYVAPEVGL